MVKLGHPQKESCVTPPPPAGVPLHLENLETQGPTWKTWKNRGFSGKNLEKYYKTWKKILTSP